MRALWYACREAARNLWRHRGSSAFAALACALAVLVLGAFLLVTANVEQVMAQWRRAAEFSVYLRDDATAEQQAAVEMMIDASGLSERREYVSKREALGRFRREYSELSPLVDDFDDNPFPASVEVQVDAGAASDGRVEAMTRRLMTMAGVADVRYDEAWLSRVASGTVTLRRVGLALALVMALAAALTMASVVRLGLLERHDELEIMWLAGAPLSYIHGPVIAEGVLTGGIGALLALGVLRLGFLVALSRWGGALAPLLDGARVIFLSGETSALLIIGGMMVGAAGGALASRHAF